MAVKPRPGRSALEKAKALASDDAMLEEGDYWFAVATPWWEAFLACEPPEAASAVTNEPLVDVPRSSKARKVALLQPALSEGSDLVFLPELAWELISHKLGFDWEVRREVVYQRSQQELQVEAYPLAFHLFFWPPRVRGDEPSELQDALGNSVVVLTSRAHTLGDLLGEVWLAAPDAFRRQFPQFVGGDAAPATPTSPHERLKKQTRLCYRAKRPGDDELWWTPVEKLLKRRRGVASASKLKARAAKRQARDVNSEDESESKKKRRAAASEDDSENGEAEFDESAALLGEPSRGELGDVWDVKLGDLRLDNRSEVAHGSARLHALLVEQRETPTVSVAPEDHVPWPSEAADRRWRVALAQGHALDALDTSRHWFEAVALQAKKNKVLVHYRGWESKWDEWLARTSPRLAPPHAHVPRWRAQLMTGDEVQLGLQIPGHRHVKWRDAKVIEVKQSTGSGPLSPADEVELGGGIGSGAGKDGSAWRRVHLLVDGDALWFPVQDDLVCQVGTHQESKPLTKSERRLLTQDDALGEDEETAESAADAPEDEEEEAEPRQEALDDGAESSPPSRAPGATDALVYLMSSPHPSRSAKPSQNQGRGRTLSLSIGDVGLKTPTPTSAPVPTTAARPGRKKDRATTPAEPDVLAKWTRLEEEFRTRWVAAGEALVALVESVAEPEPDQGSALPRRQASRRK